MTQVRAPYGLGIYIVCYSRRKLFCFNMAHSTQIRDLENGSVDGEEDDQFRNLPSRHSVFRLSIVSRTPNFIGGDTSGQG
jgi:hypothetical protein